MENCDKHIHPHDNDTDRDDMYLFCCRDLSKNEQFVNELRTAFRFMVSVVLRRIKEVS